MAVPLPALGEPFLVEGSALSNASEKSPKPARTSPSASSIPSSSATSNKMASTTLELPPRPHRPRLRPPSRLSQPKGIGDGSFFFILHPSSFKTSSHSNSCMAANLLMTATVLAQVTRWVDPSRCLPCVQAATLPRANSTRGPSPDVRTLAGGRGIA